MGFIRKIMNIPVVWNFIQQVFGCDKKKQELYRSVLKEGGRILDFGCADGNTFKAFSDLEYYGLDINKQLIDYACRKYKSYKNAHFIRADILKKPFPDQYFDSILFAMTGHHIPDEMLFKIMKALTAVLKTGGHLYFFDTIKDPKRRSLIIKTLINLDQGKFMRSEKIYTGILDKFDEKLKPVATKVFKMRGNLAPQPTYFYAEFLKR